MTRSIIALLASYAVLAPQPAQDGAATSDIYKAIRNDDLPALQREVASSAAVDVTDDRVQTPLMKAAAMIRFAAKWGLAVSLREYPR